MDWKDDFSPATTKKQWPSMVKWLPMVPNVVRTAAKGFHTGVFFFQPPTAMGSLPSCEGFRGLLLGLLGIHMFFGGLGGGGGGV